MSLPPGFLDELRTRVSLADVVGRKVTWDRRKSNPARGDWWAPCPFHQEKTPSFHVDDRKGFYYCFGCQAKGDAIGFVEEIENVGFMEAVEILAREAGLEMPERDPAERQREGRRATLVEVMEQAVRFYRLQLATARAQAAREYLARRGLSAETQARFEIGYAPDDRHALTGALTGKGVDAALLVEAGLSIAPEDGGRPFDRFRGRIMFPIRDPRGRCIAFGGRALSAEAKAKYLNSPETPLFDKGRTLFNYGPAREAAGRAGALVVAEGYIDVIALVAAGVEHAVAPLGTAITEDQLRLMWRVADEPVIALDGDRAGLRAAYRLIELALPLLAPGKSLRFCLLPEGQDPDDLIRNSGPVAMRAALEAALPMVELLWRRETEGRVFDSPERRAGLDASLRTALSRIADASLRGHYEAAIRERRAALFRPERPAQSARPGGRFASGPGRRDRFGAAPAAATPGARASALAQGRGQGPGDESAARVREGAILLGCLNHPALAEKLELQLAATSFFCRDLDEIRAALLSALPAALDADPMERRARLVSEIMAITGADPLHALGAIRHLSGVRALRDDAAADLAEATVQEALARHAAIAAAEAEVRDAEREITGEAGEGVTWRLAQAAEARARADRVGLRGEQAAAEEENALSERLRAFDENQIWIKRRRGKGPANQ